MTPNSFLFFGSIGRAFDASGPKRLIEVVARYLGGAMSRKQLRRADASIAAQQFIALLAYGENGDRYFMQEAPNATRTQIKRTVERALDTFLDGCGLPATTGVSNAL